MSALAGLPLFEAHSEPLPKKRKRPATYQTKRPTRCLALRRYMAGGEWFPYWDLVRVGGARFPARLWDIAEGIDGGNPVSYQVRHDEADHTKTEYRLLIGVRR